MYIFQMPLAWLIISVILWYTCDLLQSKAANEKLAFEKYNLDIGYKSELKLIVARRFTQTTAALFMLSVVYGLVQSFIM